MISKKMIRSIAWLMSVSLLMMGVPVHAGEIDVDAEAVQEEAEVDVEGVQNEEWSLNGEAEQNEEVPSIVEIEQNEGVSLDGEAKQNEEVSSDVETKQNEVFSDEETKQAEEAGVFLADEDSAQKSNGLSLSVVFPSVIKCGEPLTFKVIAQGGSGQYEYRLHSLLDSELVSVYDTSYGENGAYQASNEFKFTFYASGTYYIRFSVMDKGSTPINTVSTGLYEYPIKIQDDQYPSVGQRVNTLAAQCLQKCSTDFEKALWMHDWILDHADYDYSYSYCSAEGVLARGKGTCESYHRAYVKLLNKVGIETGRIAGNGHVWTAVKMDGNWYQVDSTWDDMGEAYKGKYNEHLYFGLTDDIMGLVHSDHAAATPGYESISLENNYFIKTGQIRTWSDPLTTVIEQKITAGEKEFALAVTDAMPDSYKNVIYNLAAYQLSQDKWGDNISLSASYSNNQVFCLVSDTTRPITSVSLNKTQLSLTEGGSSTLTAAIAPVDTTENKTLSWSSSNTKVATVAGGKVTAVTAGEATITVKTVNGKSASCKVTVTKKAKPITSVSLNRTQLTLTEGGSSTLTATIAPVDTTENKTLSWSSSNTKVATVAGGKVTAVTVGEATITVKTANGKSASCKVTVTKKAKPITSVSLNRTQLTLTEGGSSTLTATIAPADTTQSKTLSWSSSNAKIATVSNGRVTAVTAGEAAITVKTANGKSASCKVTVTKKAKPITSVSLNRTQLTLTEGGSSTLAATIAPADTTQSKTLSWSSSNANVATVSNGKVTAVTAGEAVVTVKTANGKSASCKVTVTKKAKPITSVSLNGTQLTLTEGESSTLAATIVPADTTQSKTLSWSSSNANVATVSNGKVTAVTAGEAVVTVKTANGKNAGCKVTVYKKEISTPEPSEDEGENQYNPPCFFPDVKSGDWYQESVDFVSSRGIMTGMGDGRFAPSEKLSRAQFATILHRMAGTPEPEYYMEMFPDVPEGQFYTKASIWAREAGVITGYSDGRFGPAHNITREQMAVMMYRYANMLQRDVSARGNLWDFPDASNVSGFAWDALEWAVGNGLINGDQGRLNPGGTANRAECATIIMRFMNAYGL